ncbi:MAG: membrane protein insertase YidC [Deltaproteobacteria bacterium]|nr:membrane protein insertase YidC [Deltaproteobacteria bacterium]
MEKRALLAFALSLIVLFGYQYLFPTMDRIEDKSVQSQALSKPAEKFTVIPKGNKREEVEKNPLKSSEKNFFSGTSQLPEKTVRVDTNLATYFISTKNAVIKEIIIKAYHDKKGNPIHLIHDSMGFYPLQIFLDGKILNADFAPSRREITLNSEEESATLKMTYKNPNGGWLEKRFIFHRDDYRVGLEITQDQSRSIQLLVGSYFQKQDEKAPGGRYNHVGPVLQRSGKVERIKFKNMKERKNLSGEIPWAAFEEKYFLTALLPKKPADMAVMESFKQKGGISYVIGIIGRGKILSYNFYAGPKEYKILKKDGLVKVINFGFFGFLAKPMFFILKGIYGVVGNYGVAIILLTSFIKLIFAPLTHKQQKSMQEMQRLQPEISAIREKYKKDPQVMNREIMGLYKKYKVNPASGCLPLVIQIPVFFALYNVLLNAIELRQAPFLYIHDLSAADTLFGHVGHFAVGPLPLLMGVTMFLQQKMTPSTMDPKQAKLFQYMPVIFTFMFLNFPSGLVLYWLINNVLTIAQQLYINQQKKPVPA